MRKENSTYRPPTASTSSSRGELDGIDFSKEGKEEIIHQSLADNPKKKSSQYTVKREQVTNPKIRSTSTDTEKDISLFSISILFSKKKLIKFG